MFDKRIPRCIMGERMKMHLAIWGTFVIQRIGPSKNAPGPGNGPPPGALVKRRGC